MTVLAIHDGVNKLIRAIGWPTDGEVTIHCEGWNSLSLDSFIIRLLKLLGDLRGWCRSQERDPARPSMRLAQKPIIPPALRDELNRIAELARTMPTVAEQITQHASTGPQPAADKNTRGRKPKLVDPQEDDIRQKYNQVRTIKGTIEALALKSLRRVTAHTRVQRIVNADKRAKSRAKSS